MEDVVGCGEASRREALQFESGILDSCSTVTDGMCGPPPSLYAFGNVANSLTFNGAKAPKQKHMWRLVYRCH